jgi:hypothetical protein
MDTIDITDCKLRGHELHDEIVNRVWDTQRVIIQPLPSFLKMTKRQFVDLGKLKGTIAQGFDPQHLEPEEFQDKFYMTKHNIMEIEVVHE